jgi:cytochrome P450
MRHSPIAGGTSRAATEDVELAGVVIPAGTMVLTNTAAANRDPAIYDDANRFDITRREVPPILTFGGGAHSVSARTWPASKSPRRSKP